MLDAIVVGGHLREWLLTGRDKGQRKDRGHRLSMRTRWYISYVLTQWEWGVTQIHHLHFCGEQRIRLTCHSVLKFTIHFPAACNTSAHLRYRGQFHRRVRFISGYTMLRATSVWVPVQVRPSRKSLVPVTHSIRRSMTASFVLWGLWGSSRGGWLRLEDRAHHSAEMLRCAKFKAKWASSTCRASASHTSAAASDFRG